MAGTGKVCYHNSLELANLGHEVTVFTSRYPDEDWKYPDSIKVVRFKPLFRAGNALFMPRLVALEKFDIVHLHHPFIFGSELILLNSAFRRNSLVVTYHQDLILNGVLKYPARIYNYLASNRVLSKAKKILTPSLDYLFNSQVRHIVARREADVSELPNGVDVKIFNPDINVGDVEHRYGLKNERVVLFVGALDKAHWFKGLDILIRAFSKIESQKVVLVIVGEGELKGKYQKLTREMGVADRTIFVGRVSERDLPKYYSLSDFLVLPSTTGGEIFGLVLVEAMACGKPVIATNLPGVRTVVDDGGNGFLAEPGNVEDLTSKIQCLLSDEHLRKRFGECGRRKVESKYSWDKIGRKLEQVYVEVLSTSKSAISANSCQ
jgi:glycosyltransferase involved in cell wall biosynthesis